MMLAALMAIQALPAPPVPPNWNTRVLDSAISATAWTCKLVDEKGHVFSMTGTTPDFTPPDTVATEKSLIIKSPDDPMFAGEQKITVKYGGDVGSFDIVSGKSTPSMHYHMALFLNRANGGLATVHTENLVTKERGYYAAGLCQSNYGRW